MTPSIELAGSRLLVLGLGASGLSMVRLAASRGARSISVHDSREQPPGIDELRRIAPLARCHSGPLDASHFAQIDCIAISPGVAPDQLPIRNAVAAGIPLLGDIELFAQALAQGTARPVVLAVTGTNGKTTVTTLAGALARAGGFDVAVAGNIGPAALDALLEREATGRMPQVWVLELSSFQLETTSSLQVDAAVMLNLSEDHLDRHAGLEAYAAAKARIFLRARMQVLNRDDPASLAMRRDSLPVLDFGLDAPAGAGHYGLARAADGRVWLAEGPHHILPLDELRLVGRHNAANALAALALVQPLGIARARLAAALRDFAGLAHRVERVAEVGGVRFYDDSKGTNVGATVAALDGLGASLAAESSNASRIVLIAGGDGKGQRFEPLCAPVRRHVREVVLIGRDAPLIEQALAGTVPITRASDMPAAVARARAAAAPGDAVLLSPACASLDMFRDYAHRAEVFVAAVKDIVIKESARV
jgi:UDP-N-acetylmuramoylalanine--D-glutamate ligase